MYIFVVIRCVTYQILIYIYMEMYGVQGNDAQETNLRVRSVVLFPDENLRALLFHSIAEMQIMSKHAANQTHI